MAAIRSNAGGQLLNQYLVARIFAFDDDLSEARAACVAKGWEAVRRGPAWIAYASERAAKAAAAAVVRARGRRASAKPPPALLVAFIFFGRRFITARRASTYKPSGRRALDTPHCRLGFQPLLRPPRPQKPDGRHPWVRALLQPTPNFDLGC